MDVRVIVKPGDHQSSTLNGLPVEIMEADLRDSESLQRSTKGIDVVFHIAAMYREAGYPESVYQDVNTKGTERLLEASMKNDVQRFVHCSTIGVLGHIANPPADETSPYNPGDEYQRSKMGGELAALRYYREHKFPVSVVRPAAIYGPGDLRLLKLFKMIAAGRAIMLGNGETLYHMVYVDDLVKGFLLASKSERAPGEVFIIADERYVTLNRLYEMIADAIGVPLRTFSLPVRPIMTIASAVETVFPLFRLNPPLYKRRVDFFTKNRAFDISKAKEHLGYFPEFPLETGIGRTAEWYKRKGFIPVER